MHVGWIEEKERKAMRHTADAVKKMEEGNNER